MEPEDEKKKKLNDDVVVFMRKRSETETPRYTARLKTYVDIQQKHRRAAAARRHTAGYKPYKASTKKEDQKLPTDTAEHGNDDDRMSRRMGGRTTEKPMRMHSFSRSESGPSDRCGKRRRRRSVSSTYMCISIKIKLYWVPVLCSL
ncbi:unnamed protein product [Arctia plantaginis]|uniref:Uncharacterized protein n=1 Tax=Arctia plantaginis TaxID=874455 RepID=A0A8S0ZSZ1_ARCPL|nr:unnamed protein product [Arctia plantaginis]